MDVVVFLSPDGEGVERLGHQSGGEHEVYADGRRQDAVLVWRHERRHPADRHNTQGDGICQGHGECAMDKALEMVAILKEQLCDGQDRHVRSGEDVGRRPQNPAEA